MLHTSPLSRGPNSFHVKTIGFLYLIFYCSWKNDENQSILTCFYILQHSSQCGLLCCQLEAFRKELFTREGKGWWLGDVSHYCSNIPQLSHCSHSDRLGDMPQCCQTTWNLRVTTPLLMSPFTPATSTHTHAHTHPHSTDRAIKRAVYWTKYIICHYYWIGHYAHRWVTLM